MRSGIGLRHGHVRQILDRRPAVAFLEVHSENYMSAGGPRRHALFDLRHDYPVSLHGVGLSLGSAGGLSEHHLERLHGLIGDYEPFLVSEHLAWSVTAGHYYNDLLPLPYSEESLAAVCRNVDRAQERLGRRILVENPSSYLAFAQSAIPEPEFLAELVRRSGCGLLLDVNNLYVSATNLGFAPETYLAALPSDAVGEIHLAGHAVRAVEGHSLLIDDHGSRVCDAVWALYRRTLQRIGERPALIEWDTALPSLEVLLDEAASADAIREAGRLAGAA